MIRVLSACVLSSVVVLAADLPPITAPVMFDTPEADRILAAMQIFPPDNPWNEDIASRPVDPNSRAIVASIGPDRPLGYNLDMNFVIVPPAQPKVPVRVTMYPKESDPGPFPVPANAPIENWPLAHNEDSGALPKPGVTLEQFQRVGTGDRHLILVDPVNGKLHEFWQARLTDSGWEASQATTFDLHSNAMRPEGWTSSDAAGLPIFPAVVRYDEVARGRVTHALRVTVRRTRRGVRLSGAPLREPAHRSGAAADGRAAAPARRLRHLGLSAARARDSRGIETLRDVRGGQRARLAPLNRARSPLRGVGHPVARQGLRLRGHRADRRSRGSARRNKPQCICCRPPSAIGCVGRMHQSPIS